MAHDPETADRIRKLLAGRSDISETRMMGGLSFMAGGAMICAVSGEGGLLVRVTPATREAALARPYAGPARIAGREMRGFVRVASEGHADEAALAGWIETGLAAAAEAGPSPRKKRRG